MNTLKMKILILFSDSCIVNDIGIKAIEKNMLIKQERSISQIIHNMLELAQYAHPSSHWPLHNIKLVAIIKTAAMIGKIGNTTQNQKLSVFDEKSFQNIFEKDFDFFNCFFSKRCVLCCSIISSTVIPNLSSNCQSGFQTNMGF